MGAMVFVVEDDAAILRMLGSLFHMSDLESVLLTNAEDALERLRDEQPAVILCDLNLPGMDGVAFIDAVRSASVDVADIPVVLISAYDEPKEHSADAFLGKPFDPFEVVQLAEAMSREGRYR